MAEPTLVALRCCDVLHPVGIGDTLRYISKGRECSGVVINYAPARLTDQVTDETYLAQKFYVWNTQTERGEWICALKLSPPDESRSKR